MCLLRDEKIEEKVKNDLKKGKNTFWKIVVVNRFYDGFYSYYQGMPIPFGWNISNRTDKEIDVGDRGKIYQGIHVYLTRKDVRKAKKKLLTNNANNAKIIKVLVYPNDLVAAGKSMLGSYPSDEDKPSAVFMKVFVPKNQ